MKRYLGAIELLFLVLVTCFNVTARAAACLGKPLQDLAQKHGEYYAWLYNHQNALKNRLGIRDHRWSALPDGERWFHMNAELQAASGRANEIAIQRGGV